MRIQQITRLDEVRERYMPGVGATHPCGVSASAPPRWSLPPRAPSRIQKISGANISSICAEYKSDQFSMSD